MKTATDLIKTLDQTSQQLAASVKHETPSSTRCCPLRQLAWMVRNSGGDASLAVTNAMAAGKIAPEALDKYHAAVITSNAAWSALKSVAFGVTLPAALEDGIKNAEQNYFAEDYVAKRESLMDAVVAGQTVAMTPSEWSGLHRGQAGLAAEGGGRRAGQRQGYAQDERGADWRLLTVRAGAAGRFDRACGGQHDVDWPPGDQTAACHPRRDAARRRRRFDGGGRVPRAPPTRSARWPERLAPSSRMPRTRRESKPSSATAMPRRKPASRVSIPASRPSRPR